MDDVNQKLATLELEIQRLGFDNKALRDNLNRIEPLYKKFYTNPFFWFYRPLDWELENHKVFQCSTCNRYFLKDGEKEYTEHKKHMYSLALYTSVWVYLKIRLGLIR